MNRLTLKALLLDTIIYLKTGYHLAPNYITAKKKLCELLGHPNNISASQLLNGIGIAYKQNGIEEEFWKVIDKHDAEKYL